MTSQKSLHNRGLPRAFDENGKPICGAKRANQDITCKNPPLENGRCYRHGGRTPKGIASPHFKHGQTSRYAHLPPRLSERVAEFMQRPDQLEGRENIAVIDARLSDLYSQLHSAEPTDVWADLKQRYIAIQQLRKAEEDTAEAEEDFQDMLYNGVAEMYKADKIWQDILQLTEQRRKLTESENKRIKEAGQFITAEQFMMFIQLVLGIIKQNVSDRRELNAISEALVTYNVIANRAD